MPSRRKSKPRKSRNHKRYTANGGSWWWPDWLNKKPANTNACPQQPGYEQQQPTYVSPPYDQPQQQPTYEPQQQPTYEPQPPSGGRGYRRHTKGRRKTARTRKASSSRRYTRK